MILSAVWALLAAPPQAASPDEAESIRRQVRAFVKDRGLESKAAILKSGLPAIRILHEERAGLKDEGFDRLTELLFTLKFRDFKDERTTAFRANMTMIYASTGGGAMSVDLLLKQISRPRGNPPQLFRYHSDMEAVPKEAPLQYPAGYEADKLYLELDRALNRYGLDWAWRYGVLLVSTPARLWPYPEDKRRLSAEGRAALQKLVAELDAPDPAVRDRAIREIPSYGREAIPLLREVGESAEAKLRAADLLKVLEARHGDVVWDTRCAMDRQELEGKDKEIAEQMNGSLKLVSNAWLRDVRLDTLTGVLSTSSGIRIECPELIADTKTTFDASGVTLREALLLLSKTQGFDFYVRDGRVVVDRKSEVDRLIK